MFDKTCFDKAEASAAVALTVDNVVFLDPDRFAGMAQSIIADQGQHQGEKPSMAPFDRPSQAAMAMQFAVQMLLTSAGIVDPNERATIIACALPQVMGNLLYDMGARAPGQVETACANLCEGTRLHVELRRFLAGGQ